MNKSPVALSLGTFWLLVFLAFVVARFACSWSSLAEVNDDAMAIFDAPYSMSLRNGVFNIGIAVSILGVLLTLIEMPKPAVVGTALLMTITLSQLAFVSDRAHEYESEHPFDHTDYVNKQKWAGMPFMWWGQTSREDLDMVFRETLEFMGTIQYQLLDQYTKKYNRVIEQAHEQASKGK
jgi:hypothetical protein